MLCVLTLTYTRLLLLQNAIQFEESGNVRFSNPMYEKPEVQAGENVSGQGYVTVSDINLNVSDSAKS